jgi:hypothetical protein
MQTDSLPEVSAVARADKVKTNQDQRGIWIERITYRSCHHNFALRR